MRIVIDWQRSTPWITSPRVFSALKRIRWKTRTSLWWNIWRSSFPSVGGICWSSSFVSLLNISLCYSMSFFPVVSPRSAAYLNKKGYSILPKDATDYVTKLIEQILARRRQHLERRNDFIQIMVDHEEAVHQEEPALGGLKRSKRHRLRFHLKIDLVWSFSVEWQRHSRSSIDLSLCWLRDDEYSHLLRFLRHGHTTHHPRESLRRDSTRNRRCRSVTDLRSIECLIDV